MPVKKINTFLYSGLALFFLGCLGSPYYLGYRHRGESTEKGFVSKKTEQEAREFELQFMKVLFGDDIKGLKDVVTPKLYNSIGPDRERFFMTLFENRYGVTGKSMALNHTENVRKSLFKKSIKEDGFKIYDYLGVSFWLEGTKRDARLDIYVTRIGGKIKACGFRVRDLDYDHRGFMLDEFVLEPESPKAGLVE